MTKQKIESTEMKNEQKSLSLQEIYDKICMHLFIQGVKPKKLLSDQYRRVVVQMGIMYRSPLAILLPYTVPADQINNKPINQLASQFKEYLPQDGYTLNFLEGLELYYKTYQPEVDDHYNELYKYLERVGKKYNLDVSVLKSISTMISGNEMKKKTAEYCNLIKPYINAEKD